MPRLRCREDRKRGEALARHWRTSPPSATNRPEERKMNPYSSLCDDYGVYVYHNTKMDLTTGREPFLHDFEGLRKTFPMMTDFDARESGEYVLEEDREQGSYRWVTLESRRLCSGYVNPQELDLAD